MGLFGTDPTTERFNELMGQLSELKTSVAELVGERKAIKRVTDLEKEYQTVKRELTDKQIEFDREKEKWDREKREVEHMVGLQKKRSEFENDAASRAAKLDVREENLKAQQLRFDEHVKFIEERFDQQFKSLENLTGKILDRMPTTKQLITVGAKNGDEEE